MKRKDKLVIAENDLSSIRAKKVGAAKIGTAETGTAGVGTAGIGTDKKCLWFNLALSALIALILSAGLYADEQQQRYKKETITDVNQPLKKTTEKIASILKLPDDDYFSFDDDRQFELQDQIADFVEAQQNGVDVDTSEKHSQEGNRVKSIEKEIQNRLAIGMPERIFIDREKTIPLLIGAVYTGQRAWEVSQDANLFIYIRNNVTGKLTAARPLLDARRGEAPIPSGRGKPPSELDAESWFSSVTHVDLNRYLPHGLLPGSYTVTGIVVDVMSNHGTFAYEVSGADDLATIETAVIRTPKYVTVAKNSDPDMANTVSLSANDLPDEQSIKVSMQVSGIPSTEMDKATKPYWHFNVVFVTLDQDPVIIKATVPVVKVESTCSDKNVYNAEFRLDLKGALGQNISGDHQVFVDAGNEWIGPYEIRF